MESQALRSLEFWFDFFLQDQQTQGTCALWAQLRPCHGCVLRAEASQQFSKREGLCGEEGLAGSRGKDVITTSCYSLNELFLPFFPGPQFLHLSKKVVGHILSETPGGEVSHRLGRFIRPLGGGWGTFYPHVTQGHLTRKCTGLSALLSRPLCTRLKLATPPAQPPTCGPQRATPREHGHTFSCPSRAQISAHSSSGGPRCPLCL